MQQQVPENPAKNRERRMDWLVVITALLATCYMTANVMAVKLVEIGGRAFLDAGTITFPLAYILGDVLTEIWGFRTARRVIFLTFACNLLMVLCTWVGVFLPAPDYMADTAAAYRAIFTVTPRILFASLVAFVAGELSNSFVMVVVKRLTHGRYLFVRTIASSAVGYVFDTGLFVLLAFTGTAPARDLLTMIGVQYAAKLGIEALCSTPLAYGMVAFLRRRVEGADDGGN